MKRLLFSLFVLGLLAAAPAARSQSAEDQAAKHDDITLTFDVCNDGRTFRRFDGVNPFESASPVVPRGTMFILNGKIYPAGTIPAGDGTFSPDTPGSIGDWYCRGIFIHSLDEILAGEGLEVDTTSFFKFTNGDGLTTEGLEGGVPTMRTLTGGFGGYIGASGQVLQERLGMNATGDFNERFTFTIKRKSLK